MITMKKITIILLLIGVSSQLGFTQFQTIEIRENQTSHLIFPSDILYTDIGDNANYIISYTNNILRIKGLKTKQPTNLTVITQNQYYYSFYVQYTHTPKLNYFIQAKHSVKLLEETSPLLKKPSPAPIIEKEVPQVRKVNTIEKQQRSTKNIPLATSHTPLIQQAEKLLTQSNRLEYISARHGDILLKMTGIYHSLEHCFITYQIRNRGAIPYDISYIEFGMREKRRPKKSAINEEIFTPLLLLKEQNNRVLPKRTNTYVAVFNKIAIPKGKIFYMELVEAGRNILLSIPYNKLPIEPVKNTL